METKQPLLASSTGSLNDGGGAPPKVYAARWWILLTFCSLSFIQALCWNFYAPISFAAKEVYGWSDNNIAWVANAANIAMLTSIPPSQWAAERLGNRVPTVACAFMMVVCSGLRCLPSLFLAGDDSDFSRSSGMIGLMVVSMVFNGWSAAWLNFAGPIISASWFALEERATVTAIITCTPAVGTSVGFVLGPLLMDPSGFPAGCGDADSGSSLAADSSSSSSVSGHAGTGCPGAATLHGVYYAEAAFAAVVFVAVLCHFPALPPTPPTRSAAMMAGDDGRDDANGFRQVYCACTPESAGLWVRALQSYLTLLCGRALMCLAALLTCIFLAMQVVAFAFAIPIGVYGGWSAVLAINLEEFGITAIATGWLGCGMTLCGCVAGVAIGALTDRFRGKMKGAILLCYSISTAGFLWFALIILKVRRHPAVR